MTALLQSTTILMYAQSRYLAGDQQWPRVHLSVFGNCLGRLTGLMRARFSTAQVSPSGLAPEGEPAASAPGQQAAPPARAIKDVWREALSMACRLAWDALLLRHSDGSRAGALEDMHLHSAYLLSLGLGEGRGSSRVVAHAC